MAWLQNLAGRAEDLLNKIDQNAATVLSDTTTKTSDEPSHVVVYEEKYQEASVIYPQSSADVIQSSFEADEVVKSVADETYVVDNVPHELNVAEDIFEKTKSGSPCSKSLSSHNSFVLTEDVQNYNEKISKLELEVQDLNKQLLNLQHLYAELRNENANLLSQVESSNEAAATAQSEMEQYKARAQRILQEKENLISLKSESKSENSDHILVNYNDELKKELEFQHNKNVELTEKNKKLGNEIAYFQQQIVLTQKSSQQTTQVLEENLLTEKKNRMIAEEDCRLKSGELLAKVNELGQQQLLMQLKNEEISKLQEVIRRKTEVSVSSDLEMRIKSLTETLMLKQNTLEQITTERNALRIQLEKLESEYQNKLVQLQRAQVRVINMNDTDDGVFAVKSQVPQFLKVTPLDAGVTRRVKHAYSTLDAISIRTGIFLRRYPFARVFVFCYMILLHFWALVLLLFYAPSTR